jgi:hypothetical protein
MLSIGADALFDATAISQHLAAMAADAARYAEKASGDGTRRTYGSAWAGYAASCQRHGLHPLAGDPGIVALYLTARAKAGLSVPSLGATRAAIRARHRMGEGAARPRRPARHPGHARHHQRKGQAAQAQSGVGCSCPAPAHA